MAWLSNLFAPKPQANLAHSFNNQDAAAAIESIVNTGASSLGALGQITLPDAQAPKVASPKTAQADNAQANNKDKKPYYARPQKTDKKHDKPSDKMGDKPNKDEPKHDKKHDKFPKREMGSIRESRGEIVREPTLTPKVDKTDKVAKPADRVNDKLDEKVVQKAAPKGEKATEKPIQKAENSDIAKTDNKAVAHRSDKTDKPAAQKIQKSDKEFALHILPVVPSATSKLVHLPLDNSKVIASTPITNHKTDASKAPDGDTALDQIAPSLVANDMSSSSLDNKDTLSTPSLGEQVANTAKQVAAFAEHTIETAVETVGETIGQALEKVSEKVSEFIVPADNAKSEQVPEGQGLEGQVSEEQASDKQESVAPSHPATTTDTGYDKATYLDSDKTDNNQTPIVHLVPTTHQITVNRYAFVLPADVNQQAVRQLAQDRRLATNDPRIVLLAMANSPKTLPITGTVGQFVRQTLLNAETLIAQFGITNCFIQAVNLAQSSDTPSLDFANYGFDPLSDERWAVFANKVRATSDFGVVAGKTYATPPKSTRAKNDPRGEFDASAIQSTPINADNNPPTTTLGNNLVLASKTLGEHLQEALHTVSERLDNLNLGELINSQADNQTDNQTNDKADDNTKDAQFTDTPANSTATSDNVAGDDNESLKSESKNDDNLGASAPQKGNKNYKNMIEGIAEQMLSQTGILNLSKPTPVKIKIKKPKNDKSNKPKVEIVKRKPATDTESNDD